MSDAIKALVSNVVDRKRSGSDSYILLLGAGASISSGCSNMMQIIDDVLESHDLTQFEEWRIEIEKAASINVEYGELKKLEINKQKRDRFFEIWNRFDGNSKYSILRSHLWEDRLPSKGYIDLANLIKMGYFKMVLSTNLDNLLEKSLNNIGWYQPDNFVVITNGKDRPEEVLDQLESSRASFKLVKLHGTLESPSSYAFTPEEIFNFEKNIKSSLSRILNQSLIIVGHSMQDRDIDILFEDEGKEIHFVRPTHPEIESRIDTILKVRRLGSIIEGEQGKFDEFLHKLRACIERESEEMSIRESSPSIEGFLRSIGYDHELKVPRSRFRNLPTLYVKPMEYDDIYSKLEREHVVFIIGEPHLGKTFTAFYLLWEYYQKGYETLSIKHDRLITFLHQHNGDMKNLLIELFSSEQGGVRIIHFDDPFGETMERRTDVFARELDTFLELARGYEHLRVIVTSRLNIFREAMAEVHDPEKVEMLEKDIRVHTSYHRDIILEILHRYTRFYNPSWATDKKIVAELDEKLPDLLPAPHNIEFFVRTSERKNSLEEVLSHVETSKEMIKALGEWMASLPDNEQIFLMWIEICSTAGIIFPETSASQIDLESVYNETLAYVFRKNHIAGIPINPFSRAKDKFDMILIESRDKNNNSVKYDFVHPSYHEAFWYAKNKHPTNKWWDVLNENVGEILKDLKNKVDLVQLRMIERYGKINRDLNQLLLISAVCDDPNEQLIAFEHMLELLNQFVNSPQFFKCAISIYSSKDQRHRQKFLDLVDLYLDQLPLNVLNMVPLLLFDTEADVRRKAEKIISKHFDTLPESFKRNEKMQTWKIARYLFLPLLKLPFFYTPSKTEHGIDVVSAIQYLAGSPFGWIDPEVRHQFAKISPSDLQLLLKMEHSPTLINLLHILNLIYENLSTEHKEIIPIQRFLSSDDENLVDIAQILVLAHREYFSYLAEKYTFIQFQEIFNINIRIETYFHPLMIDSTLSKFYNILVKNILEKYNSLSPTQKNAAINMRACTKFAEALNYYTEKNRYNFRNINDAALVELLLFPGSVQYSVLPALLIRYKKISTHAKHTIDELIDNPDNRWVGGSIGNITRKYFRTMISKEIKEIPIKFSSHHQKRAVGALLAEMAQNHYDANIGLQEKYEPALYELSKNSEIVRYAKAWMDYQFESFGYYDKKYWSKVKTHLNNLSKR